jgi:hypothetical protein
MTKEALTPELAKEIYELTELYGRCKKEEKESGETSPETTDQ